MKLGVPIRDMRLLDPNLLTSETGKILVRDNVIVVSIEHVRLIITADCVIIPREGFEHNPLNIGFNSLLEDVIAEFAEVRQFWASHSQCISEGKGFAILRASYAAKMDSLLPEYTPSTKLCKAALHVKGYLSFSWQTSSNDRRMSCSLAVCPHTS